ncbi:MAG: PepSY-associated TM helix domain-containing protein [Pseudomonadota bacterium]
MPGKPATEFFRQTLSAHSWLGLVIGAAMYLICLSGTLIVFHEELSRWEQPEVEEFSDFDPVVLSKTFNEWFTDDTRITPHLWAILPTTDLPRLRLASETDSWFMNADGSMGPRERNHWVEMLLDLHLYLHLPKTWGMIFVSALGAMLVALVISGFLAHPKIIRDAFKLRLGGNRQLEQTDIHNRLSVWGAPFHLMIGITGAYFGFALVILGVYGYVYDNGDTQSIVGDVFGNEPELSQPLGGVAIDRALHNMQHIAPEQSPILITVHDAGTEARFIEVYATAPGRLIYSENYIFDADGNYISRRGFSDGVAGKQIIYSFYRLHFGRFGGFGVKVLYAVLGLALTIISATGISIWLAKRRARSWLDDLWAGIVWGAPAALSVSAMLTLAFGASALVGFWASYLASIGLCLWRRNERYSRRTLQLVSATSIVSLIATYTWLLPPSAIALPITATLLVSALVIGAIGLFNGRATATA